MITPQEFIRTWQSGNLVTFSPAVVQHLNLAESSKLFLTEAGLPNQHIGLDTDIRICPELPLLGETFGNSFLFPDGCAPYRVLYLVEWRQDNSNEIFFFGCLDELGQVIAVFTDWDGSIAVDFQNSSVQQYAAFLLVVDEYDRWMDARRQNRKQFGQPFTYAQWNAKSEEVHQTLRSIDPQAFEVTCRDRATRWQEHLYGMEQGVDWSP